MYEAKAHVYHIAIASYGVCGKLSIRTINYVYYIYAGT